MNRSRVQKRWRQLRKKLVQNHPDGLIDFSRVLRWSASEKFYPHVEISQMFRARFSMITTFAMWVLQIWYGLRWVLFDAWFSIFRAINDYADHSDMARSAQFWRLVKYTFSYAIPASDLYENGLMTPNAPVLDYVFSTETQGYHLQQNRNHFDAQSARDLLADKSRFGDEMGKMGVPVPNTMSVEQATQQTLANMFPAQIDRIFVKLRSANAGFAAFSATKTANGLTGQNYRGAPLLRAEDVELAWKHILSFGDVIIQPFISNHATLASLSNTNTAVTLRLVTKFNVNSPLPVAARLEIPVWDLELDGQISYVLFPINLKTGALEPSPKRGIYGHAFDTLIDDIFAKCPPIVPCWDEIASYSIRAHHRKFDLYAIAWDWVITDDGPLLLEGNSGFGLDTQQMQNGGLLAD
ncbi:hypothetical protein GCM10008927_25610 [Amylibacter ulvae]|uniref:Alpha-L-glutamate ligase-related protein ATP-grasp domain-containing protein n=1 Tax=Paramylibacter ulvae TaxID=1651968 RepID=A0ABQ3D6N8_9RHOB|nr:sugar-transfer associated ATP-grasp domain-containing protein [Amylibacter ulvae]GHA58832.1 hypothetical protein GCM10008927_25610 [Amylibacter ulvae]